MLVFAGLPNLLRNLVDSRTYAERVFRVCFLDRLGPEDSEDAIRQPIADAACPLELTDDSVGKIIESSGGHPYFLQFICKEVVAGGRHREHTSAVRPVHRAKVGDSGVADLGRPRESSRTQDADGRGQRGLSVNGPCGPSGSRRAGSDTGTFSGSNERDQIPKPQHTATTVNKG